jgi:hypothetical protein
VTVEGLLMGFFSRKPRSRFPDDMMRRLELLGRFEMDSRTSGIDGGQIFPECIGPFLDDAKSDTEGFVTDLRSLVASDRGGFALYGAHRLVMELLGPEFRTPDALALMDSAIAFKRERGLPSAHLTGYEWGRWREVNGVDSW